MISKSGHIFAAIFVLVASAVVWFLLSNYPNSAQSSKVDTEEADVPGPLDGMKFLGVIGPGGNQTQTKDEFIFSKGKFVSTECVKVCGYHAGPYFVRERDGKTEFLSVSRCAHKDARIEWRGTIYDGVVKGESTWTVKRWYRTVEKKLFFEGNLVRTTTPVAGK